MFVHDTVKAASSTPWVLPGGTLNADALRGDEDGAVPRRLAAAASPWAAICHAPWLLVETGLADGRELALSPPSAPIWSTRVGAGPTRR